MEYQAKSAQIANIDQGMPNTGSIMANIDQSRPNTGSVQANIDQGRPNTGSVSTNIDQGRPNIGWILVRHPVLLDPVFDQGTTNSFKIK